MQCMPFSSLCFDICPFKKHILFPWSFYGSMEVFFGAIFFFLTRRTYTKETPWNRILLKRTKNMFQPHILQKIFFLVNTHRNTSTYKHVFFSPSIKKESVEGDEPTDCNSSSEWDLLLQVLPSLSDSKDVPDLRELEGGRRVSSSSGWDVKI